MKEDNQVLIRTVRHSDLNALKEFFIKAYGESTVFQDEQFLIYYFKIHDNSVEEHCYSIVGVTSNGDIVSHYGGLHYKLKLKNKIITVIWGVNAFTLPEWRGKGINSKIVNYIQENNEANAVIGMPFDAPLFYKKFGYNIFNKETLHRYIYSLNEKTFEIASHLGHNNEKVNKYLKIRNAGEPKFDSEKIVDFSTRNFETYNFNLEDDIDNVATTYRDNSFLKWRVFENPYIKYKVFGYLVKNEIVAYIVVREEILLPLNYKVNRIIDLYGNKEGVLDLLNFTINYSHLNKLAYIDFSAFGNLFEKELLEVGFDKLENDDVCMLPMVSSPIENRPNHEFIVIQSKSHHDTIQNLSSKNVYFTRIDADRDRIARITQINK